MFLIPTGEPTRKRFQVAVWREQL